jgi:hypothetical protein
MRVRYGDHIRKILENHYEWCKLNDRDTSWYDEYKQVSTKKKLNIKFVPVLPIFRGS